ncbi:MAG: hypothetical protein Q7S44_03220 [bacterium]|nr:hypothetical protein [bacterium]
MEKQEVINHLKRVASQLEGKKYITLKDVRSVPKLDYYIHFHFRGMGNALRAANLPSSKLASSMSIKSEDLLNYLRDLKDKLNHNPTVWDIQDDKEIYKKYSENKFSWSIFKTRFNGLRKAIEQMELVGVKDVKNDAANVTIQAEKEDTGSFEHKNRYFGKAAELHVTAELIYRGFQATNIPIDVGLDILAFKDKKTFYFQVKHKDFSHNIPIKLTKSSFEKSGGGDVYYIFVLLSDKKRDFLIIPFHIVSDWIRDGLAEEKEDQYLIVIKKDGDDYKLKDRLLNNKYLDKWENIR